MAAAEARSTMGRCCIAISDARVPVCPDALLLPGIILLFLFLNSRVAFWVTMGIPACLLATWGVMYLQGGTINMLSLFGMIMALGIIVDDAIVVGEDTLTHVQQGESSLSAALSSAQRMFAPVVAASLTTVAAFSFLKIMLF